MKRIRHFKTIGLWGLLLAGLCVVGITAPAQAEIKELKIGIGVDADTLNPQEQTTTLIQNICDLIYDTLFFQKPDGTLVPRLATGYEVSDDGLTWTIHLREGVTFSDGAAFNAKVMKQTFDRILNPGMRVPLRFAVSMVKECTIVDDYTVALHLKFPFAPLADTLSMTLNSPISPKALEEYGEDVRQHPVGAGPYILEEWVKGDRLVMVRNEDYFGKKPTVKKIIWKVVPEVSTREAMLRSGQIDICYKPSPANVAALKADPNVKVEMPPGYQDHFHGAELPKGGDPGQACTPGL